MKLTIELVPETSWWKNIRDEVSDYKWNKLSKQIQKNANYKCEICGRRKGEELTRLYCHEKWEYNEHTKIQKLVELQSLCFQCHCVKHIGFTRLHHKDILDEIIQHFLNINGVSMDEFKKHDHESVLIWKERSKIEWEIDLGEFSSLVEEMKKSREEKKREEYEQVFNVLKDNPMVTNKQIEEFTQLNKTAVKRYATEARKELKRQRQSIIYS
jgi:hypothetical protein